MRKIELFSIPEDIYGEVGKLTLVFSHVEWLIANTLLLGKMTPSDHSKVGKLTITQDHFEVLLGLNFSRKIEALKNLDFDVSKLNAVSSYRNTLSHGIIFKDEDTFTIKKTSKPDSEGVSLHKNEIQRNIETLKEEGGKLLDFIEAKGYKYHEPN
ncbi:MAG: hypothetical protein WC629_01175 [Candidatus Paceibacterota bacterium]|jgi:hypothetical protein